MGQNYLLDTNVAIYFLNGQLTTNAFTFVLSILQSECNLSVITKMELLGWQSANPADEKKIQDFVKDATITSCK